MKYTCYNTTSIAATATPAGPWGCYIALPSIWRQDSSGLTSPNPNVSRLSNRVTLHGYLPRMRFNPAGADDAVNVMTPDNSILSTATNESAGTIAAAPASWASPLPSPPVVPFHVRVISGWIDINWFVEEMASLPVNLLNTMFLQPNLEYSMFRSNIQLTPTLADGLNYDTEWRKHIRITHQSRHTCWTNQGSRWIGPKFMKAKQQVDFSNANNTTASVTKGWFPVIFFSIRGPISGSTSALALRSTPNVVFNNSNLYWSDT